MISKEATGKLAYLLHNDVLICMTNKRHLLMSNTKCQTKDGGQTKCIYPFLCTLQGVFSGTTILAGLWLCLR